MYPRFGKIFAVVFILFSTFLGSPATSFAQTTFSRVKKVIVLDFYDGTKLFDGQKAADRIRYEMRRQSRFTVLSKKGMLSKFRRLGISRSKMLNKQYRLSVGESTNADAFVVGVMSKGTRSKYKLILKMEEAGTGKSLRTYTFPFNRYIGPKAARAATRRFLGKAGRRLKVARRIPKAVPTPVPETRPEITTPPEPMKELVPELMGQPYAKKPSLYTEERPKKAPRAYEGAKRKQEWISLKLGPAFFKNKYTVRNPSGSTPESLLDVSTGFFPDVYFTGEIWFLKFLGLDFMYNMGFLKLSVQPPAQPAFNVNSKFWQFGTNVKYRLFFSKMDKSPYAFARAGWQLSKFNPGTQTTNVLSSNKYSDISMGAGFNVPFWFMDKPYVGLNFSFDYFIISNLSEGVINNGTSNDSKGYQLVVGPYWKFAKYLFTGLDFVYMYHAATFSNPDTTQGTRTDAAAGAKSKDKYMGLIFALGFYL